MRPNLEIIDEYLSGQMSADQKNEIDRQIATDEAFAKDFSFMIMARKAAKAEAEADKKAEFESLRNKFEARSTGGPVALFPFGRNAKLAIAASLALIIGGFWFFNMQKPTPDQLADNYIKNYLSELPVMMGTDADSLAKGISLYNKKNYEDASIIFELLAAKDPKALEYMGLSTLQLEYYNIAIANFDKLSQYPKYKSRALLLKALSFYKLGEKAKSYETLKEINKSELSLEDREFVEDMAIRN